MLNLYACFTAITCVLFNSDFESCLLWLKEQTTHPHTDISKKTRENGSEFDILPGSIELNNIIISNVHYNAYSCLESLVTDFTMKWSFIRVTL